MATPILALAGAMAGQLLTRRTATELDIWRRREETMRLLRWGAELAISDRRASVALGLQVLDSLVESELLQVEDRSIVKGVLLTVSGLAVAHDGASDD